MSWITRLTVTMAGVVVGIATLVASPLSAHALESAGFAYGFVSDSDGETWLGSYRLDDGSVGLCIDVDKRQPGEHEQYSYEDGASRFGVDDRARLAFVSRSWGGSEDPEFAAAAQIEAWSVTGWGDHHSPEHVAKVAGDHADRVLAIAGQMASTVDGGASRDVRARVTLTVPPPDSTGTGTVRTDLDVDFLSRGWTTLDANSHTGTLSLLGATFEDGSSQQQVPNGVDLPIRLSAASAIVSVQASASFESLPYGATITVATTPEAQSLVVARPGSARASASARVTTPSSAPFRPRVVTSTSDQVAAAGVSVTDQLQLAVDPRGGLPEWGVYERDGHVLPVPVTIRSRLLGPYASPITPSESVPADAPEVCRVSVLAERGPGAYRTPACTLPASGYYVWVDSIDPHDTPADHGGGRLLPWQSGFGVASEVTHVPVTPTISSTVAAKGNVGEPCLEDTLHVSGIGASGGVFAVESILLGPLADAPKEGSSYASLDGLPIAGRTTTNISADGDRTTECLPTAGKGHYVFVFRSAHALATTPTAAPMPDFQDLTVYASESYSVQTPPVLASTGDSQLVSAALSGGLLAGGGVALLGLGALAGRRAIKASRSARS